MEKRLTNYRYRSVLKYALLLANLNRGSICTRFESKLRLKLSFKNILLHTFLIKPIVQRNDRGSTLGLNNRQYKDICTFICKLVQKQAVYVVCSKVQNQNLFKLVALYCFNLLQRNFQMTVKMLLHYSNLLHK